MAVPKELLSVLVCPKSQAPVRLSGDGNWVICNQSQTQYPVRDGIPVMIAEEGVPIGQVEAEQEAEQMSPEKTVFIVLVEGKNKGLELKLPIGSCRAVGRSLDDLESTRVFDASGVVGLDDSTKQLVLNYVTQQFRGSDAGAAAAHGGEDIGSFKRLPDLLLADGATSRLHAMIFHGPNGVGVLDLVSKNGTFVNGVEVESKFLQEGDVVTIGGTKMRIGPGEAST